ncbi:MAG: hypothetical protein GY790_06755 [Bacteroidetes bacterium]|nr:hypothetical protein [Bacteroidota bacterium]
MKLINGRTWLLALIIVVPFLILSCEGEENESRYDPPSDHNVSQDGAMHKSGLQQPLTNCVACHGDDLEGGTTQVSCYECHRKKW